MLFEFPSLWPVLVAGACLGACAMCAAVLVCRWRAEPTVAADARLIGIDVEDSVATLSSPPVGMPSRTGTFAALAVAATVASGAALATVGPAYQSRLDAACSELANGIGYGSVKVVGADDWTRFQGLCGAERLLVAANAEDSVLRIGGR